MRSSTMTPAPPGSDCASRAGNGFQMSKRRKRKKAHRHGARHEGDRDHHARHLVDDDEAGILAAEEALGAIRGPGTHEYHAREGGEETETGKGNEPEGDGRHRAPGGSRRDGKVAGAPAAGDREGEAVRGADRLFPHELVAVHLYDTHLGESSGREARIP